MQQIAKGLDYSARSIPGYAIKNAGYNFAIRYVGFPGNRKCITPQEYKDLIANGIRVYAVYEYDTNDSMGGYAGGQAAAVKARADMTRIGFPADAICFFCADRHLANWEVPISQQYINGAASILGWDKTGAYGFQEFIWAIQRDSNCKYLWQCGAESYVREGVHFYQWNNGRDYVDGVECDINKQFLPVGGHAPGGGGTGGDDLLSDEREWLRQIYEALSKPYVQNGVDVGDVLADLGRQISPVTLKDVNGVEYTTDFRNAWASVYGQTFLGSIYGFGESIIERLASLEGRAAPVIDVDKLAEAVKPAIADAIRPVVEEIIRTELGKDNKELADRIIQAMAEKLSAKV